MNIIKCENAEENCVKCSLSAHELERILEPVRSGKLIVYSTDTLYAIGADPFNEDAVKLLFEAKNRPKEMPISVSVANLSQAEEVAHLSENARRIFRKCLPGPLTLLVRAKEEIAQNAFVSRDGILGIRVPRHPLALRLSALLGPVTATSANLHGDEEPSNVSLSVEGLGSSVETYVDCGECSLGRPSVVLDAVGDKVRIRRFAK
jgi:L-threonylcarbamoyladenylate synthase